MANCHRFK